MNIQLEKSFLIDVLQNISDVSVIQRVKNFVMHEIEPVTLTNNQKIELNKRLFEHKNNFKDGQEAFRFLDNLKSKYEL